MKFADIPSRVFACRVKRSDSGAEALPQGPVLSVDLCPTRPDEFALRVRDSLMFVRPVSDADTRFLNKELAGGRAALAYLGSPAADGSVEMQIAFFTGECLDMGAVEVAADEYVEQEYKRKFHRALSGKKLYEALAERCSYIHGDQRFFFVLAGPAVDHALLPEIEDRAGEGIEGSEEGVNEGWISKGDNAPPLESTSNRPEPTRKNSFCIVGDGIRFVATEAVRPDGKAIYIVTRLTRIRAEPDRALRLARGRLTFTDWTRAGQIHVLAKAQMAALASEEGSYLKKWEEFVYIESELVLARARRFGAIEYCDMTPTRERTVRIRIAQASEAALEALADGDVESVEVIDELPEYLKNADLTFAEFAGVIERQAEDEAFRGKQANQRKDAKPHYDVVEYDPLERTLTLATENMPAAGRLILSLAGHIAQIKRRLFARKAILEGRSANPELGLLIEEKGVIARIRPPGRIRPLTAFVREKVFRNAPTERQIEAIEIALNTPDIALIQGPPGTGKTTVIAAIIERLNEIADKRGRSFRGSVLLTGLQHDAVENMIERISLNGLPVPKYGRRSGREEDDFGAFERKVHEWCRERATALRAKIPRLTEIQRERDVTDRCLQYLEWPTRALAIQIAKSIANLDIFIIGEELSRRAAHLARRLSLEEQLNARCHPLLEAVRRLRHRAEAFCDDGPEQAGAAIEDLRDLLNKDERDLLLRASFWRKEDGTPPFLSDLARLKKRLLSRFSSPPMFRVEKQNDELVALVKETITRLRTNGVSTKDAKAAALSEFLAELESDPYGMVDAVSDYAYAFAATCQQSVNRQMQWQKGIATDDPAMEFRKIEYEYVIVDEAARVTPPDLMVAMAQGRRIILVGDHRQLPHIIDEAVAGQMDAGEAGRRESEWLKKSMFAYLFSERLKKLEDADGIPRRITLDTQYRMHPLLGEFVSRNFYERFDSSEAFGSGRPESDFTHNLADTGGRPAVWLEVPAAKGRHGREGTSWKRLAEATAIAQRLRDWLESKEGQDLSFGVISFYKAQSELMEQQMRSFDAGRNRLRIGTVDSFQGMEFDVVILSMVRTMPESWKPRCNDEEVQARELFGHLCLYNRLNVAMSRQKKLLVVAGDPGLLRHDLAVKYIPGLVDFYQLCQHHGRVLPCR